MANLPSQNPNLAIQLADRTLTPLITSARSQEQHQSLSSVSYTALVANEAITRLSLGIPLRIMIEYASNGPVVLHSYLTPPPTTSLVAQNNEGLLSLVHVDGEDGDSGAGLNTGVPTDASGDPESDTQRAEGPPMLLGTVIAPTPESLREARRAAARLERVGRMIQTRWTESQRQDDSTGALGR